jgi:hypothetical protein
MLGASESLLYSMSAPQAETVALAGYAAAADVLARSLTQSDPKPCS